MTCDGNHDALRAQWIEGTQPRLDRARYVLEGMTIEQRLVVARWLSETLTRNRQAFSGVAWRTVREMLEALHEDLLWETPHRDSPVVDGALVAMATDELLDHLFRAA